jgi:peroxiredoxin Q/BCP
MSGDKMTDIVEGQPAPAFDMATVGGDRVSLAALKGRKVVLYFYPKADTPGCTTEGQDFSAMIDDFAAAGAVVIGVSRDPVKKLDRFKAKYDLKVILASDEPEDVTQAYGVWVRKKLYGREYMGVERATFLIDGAGVVRRVWRKVSVKGHAAEVLAAAQSL